MNNCGSIREMLVLHAEGVLSPAEKGMVDGHLAGCPGCAREAAEISRIRDYLADPALFDPAADLAWQLLPEKLAARARRDGGGKAKRPGLGLLKWVAIALPVIPLALALLWTARFQSDRAGTPGPAAAGNEAFLERIRSVYAREATSQYLTKCHALLLDVISAEKTCAGGRYDVTTEVTRARQLLQEKRMLDAELRDPGVERAKPLCDDLESFLMNLSTSQECENGDAVRGMETFIESRQLLLRIDLMQPGIS